MSYEASACSPESNPGPPAAFEAKDSIRCCGCGFSTTFFCMKLVDCVHFPIVSTAVEDGTACEWGVCAYVIISSIWALLFGALGFQ